MAFRLMIVGLAATLPGLQHGLVAHGVPDADAVRISHLPPVASLFAAFLGDNPMQQLLGQHTLSTLPPAQAHVLTGRGFFPSLISSPFHTALTYAFIFAVASCVVAAVASLLHGGTYHWGEPAHSHNTGSEPVPIEEAA